jgi:nitrogen fixation-related uncharacterized protein
MNTFESRLLIFWVAFSVLSVIALIPVIIWAVRSGQFADNAGAKYLPLKSGIPESDEDSKNVST